MNIWIFRWLAAIHPVICPPRTNGRKNMVSHSNNSLSTPSKYAARIAFATALACATIASAGILRIATYNIEADINGFTTPRPGLETVLEGIGAQTVQGRAQPLDILTL